MEKYTVLMSVYHKENVGYFREAVESMIKQTYPPNEMVVVCDGPLTEELDLQIDRFDKKYPNLFKIVRLEQNQGLGKALAAGLLECTNDLVARMDTDDIAIPERMEWQISFMAEHEDISIVGGQIQEFNEIIENKLGCRYVAVQPDMVRKLAANKNPMNHMTVTFRKQHVLAAGNYQEYDRFEDYYLWARMLAKGYKLANLDRICVYARVNGAMYKRRAGWDYYRQTVKMQKYLLEAGISNKKQYVRNLVVRFLGVVVVPNWLREKLYNNLMRRKAM